MEIEELLVTRFLQFLTIEFYARSDNVDFAESYLISCPSPFLMTIVSSGHLSEASIEVGSASSNPQIVISDPKLSHSQ